MKKHEDVAEIVAAQGWDDTSLLALARNFLEDNDLMSKFVTYLEDAADCENSESMDEEDDGDDGDDIGRGATTIGEEDE